MEEFENNVNASQYASPIIELCVTTTIQLAGRQLCTIMEMHIDSTAY